MPSPPDIARSTGYGASMSQGPEADAEYTDGGAPAGRWPAADWPVKNEDGPPATYNGFRPSPANYEG